MRLESTSYIVISRDQIERLRLTLAGCFAHSPPPDEILIVNDGGPLSLGGLQRAPDGCAVRVISGGGRGRAAARNMGAAHARGDLLVFLDGDVLTLPSFLAAHRAAQEHTPGLCRGRIRELIAAALVTDWSAGAPGFPPLTEHALRAGGFDPIRYRQISSSIERAVEVRFVHGNLALPAWLASAGANFSISRSRWLALRGQEDRFGTTWGCEDLEFSLRAVLARVPLTFAPDAIAFHLSHPKPERWPEHARSLALFTRLHPTPAVLALPSLLGPDGSPEAYLDALGTQSR